MPRQDGARLKLKPKKNEHVKRRWHSTATIGKKLVHVGPELATAPTLIGIPKVSLLTRRAAILLRRRRQIMKKPVRANRR